ncbi:MAG TPA: PKD domain-containing protein [Solirubrobacteraceae bacterium]|nr:PKD domain-containing protein [Solirubrobacteraceae bacterium]
MERVPCRRTSADGSAHSSCGSAPARIVALLAFLLALTGALAASAPVAAATETVVGFDGLAAGTTVTTQFESVGLRLGKADELGAVGGAGDCGAPTVQAASGATPTPPSAPNYAQLPTCTDPAAPTFEGTFGKLTRTPTGPLSVQVAVVGAVGVPPVTMDLVAYDAAGKQIGLSEGEATPSAWTKIALDPGATPVAFLEIRTKAKVSSENVGIDDLSFQQPASEPPPKTEPKPPAPPTPPTSVITVLTPSPHSGEPVTLSGAGSSPGSSGRIVSYEWDFNGDGKIDTSTGTNPIARFPLRPGPHTIGLTVTGSDGEKSTSRFGLVITGVTLPPKPDGGEGPCQTSFEVATVELLGECVQKAPGSSTDLLIQSRQLDLNGMTMVPREGGYGVWRITVKRHLGIGFEYLLSGTPVRLELPNTPIGDMTLGGYDLESSPVDLVTVFEHTPTVKLARAYVVPHAHAADEERERKAKGTVLLSLGVGKQCAPNSKDLGCCPPSGPTRSCATLPGGFPLTGTVVVYLTGKGQVLFDVQVALDLKSVSFQATGELEIIASLETGIELSSLKFSIPEASLAPVFKVKDASFAYYFPGNPDPNKRDTWQAKATITFGLLEEPGLEGELSFQHGQFHSASLALTLPPPGIPVYPGISLNKMGGSVGVEPISFGGVLGAKVAGTLELELLFKYAEATEEQLGFFGGKGTLKYEDNEIATLEGDVYSDGYSDALLQVKIGVPFGSKEPEVSVEGEIGYWDESSSGLWEAYGRVHAKIWVIEGEIAGIVNNHYIAGCGALGPFGALGFWDFQTSSVGGEGFIGNCKDHLKTYKQVPLKQHTGGFVNETETESLRGRPPKAPVAIPSSGPAATIALASDPLGRDLRISSDSGTPVVTLSGPNGQSFTTPATPGKVVQSGSEFVAALGTDPHHVIVYLAAPGGGEWKIKRAPGSAPISAIEEADAAPPPAIHASVRRGHGGRYTLAYRATNLSAGMKVRIYERGKDSIHGLATVTKPKGTLSFTPTQALARGRTIYATVIGVTGAPLQTIAVGRYTAPRPPRPGRPARLRFLRHGASATLSWSATPLARVYRVRIKGSDGRIDSFFAKPSRRSETIPDVLPSESFTATVQAVGGPAMLPGRVTAVALKAVRKKRTVARRRSRKHH